MVESLASLCAIALILTVVDGHPTTTSLDIARHFGKRHDDVLRAIRNLLPQLSADHARNFAEMVIETQIGSGATRQDPAYRVTRVGFTLLAMGFTGKKAFQFKLAYIDAFERMEAELASAPKLPPKPMLRALSDPGVDVHALLLTGQRTPEPHYPAKVESAIDKRAWELAHEAYTLLREHLRRRVAYRHMLDYPVKKIDTASALADIKTLTLGQALAHTALAEMGHALTSTRVAAVTTQQAADRIKAQIDELTKKHEGDQP